MPGVNEADVTPPLEGGHLADAVKKMSDQPSSKYWRSRAEKPFAMAETMISDDGKAWMLEIACL
jgi:hypothetical protein